MVVLVLVSQPLLAVPSQLPVPAGHADTIKLHLDAAQVAMVPTGAAHTPPQRPQLFGSPAAVFVSHPLAGSPSQFAYPASQLSEHAPPTQSGVALGLDGQRLSQPLQLRASVERVTHAPPHRTCPAGHGTQAAPTQTRSEAHGAPHAPQFALSVCVSLQSPPHSC